MTKPVVEPDITQILLANGSFEKSICTKKQMYVKKGYFFFTKWQNYLQVMLISSYAGCKLVVKTNVFLMYHLRK